MSVYTNLDKSKLTAAIANKTLAADMATKLDQAQQKSAVVTITSAQLLALNATEQEVLAAPGANKALVFEGATLVKPAGTAYAGVAAGEDLTFKYTDASGTVLSTVETTGFLDSTSKTVAFGQPGGSVAVADNAAIVLHLLVGEVTTGDSDLVLNVFYRVVDTSGV